MTAVPFDPADEGLTWRAYKTTPKPVVYRIYDDTDRLIYIGASRALPGRLNVHRQLSWWFGLIARIETDEHPTIEAAYAAEMVAIQEEQPAFNVRHTTSGPVLTEDDVDYACRWLVEEPHRSFSSMGMHDRIFQMRGAHARLVGRSLAAGISTAA